MLAGVLSAVVPGRSMQGAMEGTAAQGKATGLLGSLIRLAGLGDQAAQLTAAMRITNSVVDVLAVYVFMAALTCTLEVNMPGRVWWLRSGPDLPLTKM